MILMIGRFLLLMSEGKNTRPFSLLKLTWSRTTTDICALLKTGYPRQSAAFVKIAGVRTNFTIPDVRNIALGGGSLVRTKGKQTSIGPDSVGARLEKEAISFGGQTLTVSSMTANRGGYSPYISSCLHEEARYGRCCNFVQIYAKNGTFLAPFKSPFQVIEQA